MANEMKMRQDNILMERREREPEAFERKGIIFGLLAAMVGTRLLYAILFTVFLLSHGINVPTFEYVMMYFMAAIAYVFAFIIYAGGQKFAAYLALFGGVYSLFNAIVHDDLLSLMATGDAFLSSVMFIFFATIVIQIVTMLFISVDRKCRLYVKMRAEVQKEMQDFIKAQKK